MSLGNVDVQKDSRTIRMVGKEFNAFYGYKSDGIFQNKEEIANAPKYTMISNDRLIPGDIKLVDINEDGEINPDDKVILSSETRNILSHSIWVLGGKCLISTCSFKVPLAYHATSLMNSMVNLTVTLVTLQITG